MWGQRAAEKCRASVWKLTTRKEPPCATCPEDGLPALSALILILQEVDIILLLQMREPETRASLIWLGITELHMVVAMIQTLVSWTQVYDDFVNCCQSWPECVQWVLVVKRCKAENSTGRYFGRKVELPGCLHCRSFKRLQCANVDPRYDIVSNVCRLQKPLHTCVCR